MVWRSRQTRYAHRTVKAAVHFSECQTGLTERAGEHGARAVVDAGDRGCRTLFEAVLRRGLHSRAEWPIRHEADANVVTDETLDAFAVLSHDCAQHVGVDCGHRPGNHFTNENLIGHFDASAVSLARCSGIEMRCRRRAQIAIHHDVE